MRELDLKMFDNVSAPTIFFPDNYIDSVTTDKEEYENNEKITLTIGFQSGSMIDRVIVLSPSQNNFNASLSNLKFKTGEYFYIILLAKSSYEGQYIVTEPVMIDINGKREYIKPTQRLRIHKGELTLGTTMGSRETIAESDAVKSLIEQKILIPARSSEYIWAEIVK